MVTGAGDGRRRAAADGSRVRAESRDETRTRERVRRAGGERSSEWLGFGGVAASSFIWGGAGGGRGLGRARRACAWSCACALGGGGGNGPPPGRPLERAVPVPCLGPGVRPKHGSLLRAVLARACWPPGRAKKTGPVPGQRARAAWPTIRRSRREALRSPYVIWWTPCVAAGGRETLE